MRRASAQRITAVIPYFGYARQDRKAGPRSPISAKLVANLITRAGADRVLTVDLHAGQIQGFFDIPTDNLFAAPTMVRDIQSRGHDPKAVMVVSPDVGGVVRARAARQAPRRPARHRRQAARAGRRIGSDEHHRRRGRPRMRAARRHRRFRAGHSATPPTRCSTPGAASVSAYITHGVLSGGAVARIAASKLTELVLTDTIAPTEAVRVARNIRVISIAPLIGEAIGRIAKEESVSSCSTDAPWAGALARKRIRAAIPRSRLALAKSPA